MDRTGPLGNGHGYALTEDERYTLQRYDHFRAAAEYVAAAFATISTVSRVVLFGSIAAGPQLEANHKHRGRFHDPKDVDLAVWLTDIGELDRLRVLRSRAVNQLFDEREIGVAHHQVDVFLFDATSTYIGRLCTFNVCPKHKPECLAEGCGRFAFLRQHDDFVFDRARSLHPARIQLLYERVQPPERA
jgi:hypothetical protein